MTKHWKYAISAVALAGAIVIVGATCRRPADTVQIHRGGGAAAPTGRALAARMSVTDHRGRTVEVPAPGRVTVVSFASRSTADRGSERCRAVRVAHPEVAIVEVMDLSRIPGFMAGKVKGKLADRHQTILADTRRAFAAAARTPPADLEDQIHIVADWRAEAFDAYGATDADDEVQVAVVDGAGGLVRFFSRTPTVDDLDAAVVQAGASP